MNAFLQKARALAGEWTDVVFDLRYGTSTSRWVQLEALTIDSPNKAKGYRYQPARVLPLMRVFKKWQFPPGSVFVDFGAGKGRVLLIASLFRFRKAVGIEFSDELCRVARQNIALFKQKQGVGESIEVAEIDATGYRYSDDENVFFFFNPFSQEILCQVLGQIERSAARNPRQVWLIFYASVYGDLVEGTGYFRRLADQRMWGVRTTLYSNR